jgi:hypothetical protein
MCKIIHTMIRVIDLVRRALICRRTALTERAEVAAADKRSPVAGALVGEIDATLVTFKTIS